jgi:beta-galactosidase
VNPVGSGRAWYLATIPDAAGTASVLSSVLEAAGIAPLLDGLPDTVEVAQRGDVLTVINHGTEVATISAKGTTDLLTGDKVKTFGLEPFEYRMLRR